METIKLTLQIIIKETDSRYQALDNLCWLSKNMYNTGLYAVRQHFFNTGKYLNYSAVNKLMHDTDNPDYKAMPYILSALQVLRQVDSSFSSFFKLLKSPKMKGKKIRIPRYKDTKKGRNIIVYTNQCFKQIEDIIKLKIDKDKYVYIKTDKRNIQQVRIVHKGNHIVVEIIYPQEIEFKADNNRYASIDLGLNNICTITTTFDKPIIYNGRPLKQINQFYNKKKAKLLSLLQGKKQTSKRIKHVCNRRNNKVKDYLHKLSCLIVEYMETNSLNTLFVGKNVGWKDSIELGKRNNLNFVSIPYNTLISMLEYKCKLHGIRFILLKESYTSKCSFLDKERIGKHNTYKGKRIRRGLFRTEKGILINADVNGSLNIMRLGLRKLKVKLDVFKRPENMRFVLNPVKITIVI